MLKFGNKEFRNLEEQVDKNKQDIADLTAGISAAIGYMPTILGVYARFDEIPTGGYNTGDTFLIGSGTPYSVYVYTDKNQWVNVGQFPVAGPKGDKGDLGSVITAAAGGPQVTPESLNDFYIDTITGDWYVASRTVSGSLVYIKSFSLKGEKGDRGERGLAGSMGPAGPQGPQGPQGERGFTGLKGDQGQKGDTGATGPAGNSVTNMSTASFTQDTSDPTIFHNAIDVAYSDGTSTTFTIDTKGIKGDKGDTGPIGPTGAIGPTGPRGLQGEQGPKGDTGETGAVGPTGPQGIQGPQGPTGNGVEDLISVVDKGTPVVTYDTQNGITINSTDQYTYGTVDKTFDVSTERKIPIIAGDGISIDKAADSEHIVIKNTKEGFLPTAEQQAALDSGITADKVTSYDNTLTWFNSNGMKCWKVKWSQFVNNTLPEELVQDIANKPEQLIIYCKWYDDHYSIDDGIGMTLYTRPTPTEDDPINGADFRGALIHDPSSIYFSMRYRNIWRVPNDKRWVMFQEGNQYSIPTANSTDSEIQGKLTKISLPTWLPDYNNYMTRTLEVFSPTDTQTTAMDSGITADKVTTYDGYPTAIADAKKAGTDAQANLTAYQTSNDAALNNVKTTADNALPLSGGTLTGVLNGVRINTTGNITSGTNIKAGSTHTYTQINDTGIVVQKDTSNKSIITGSATEFIRNQTNGVITNYNLPYTDGETYTFATATDVDRKQDILTAGNNITIENNTINAVIPVTDVQVNGASVVTDKVANVDLSSYVKNDTAFQMIDVSNSTLTDEQKELLKTGKYGVIKDTNSWSYRLYPSSIISGVPYPDYLFSGLGPTQQVSRSDVYGWTKYKWSVIQTSHALNNDFDSPNIINFEIEINPTEGYRAYEADLEHIAMGNFWYTVPKVSYIDITITDESAQGTITDSQLTILQKADYNGIRINENEIYRLSDKGHTEGIWTYTHDGYNEGGITKYLNLNITTKEFTITQNEHKKYYKHTMTLSRGSSEKYSVLLSDISSISVEYTLDTIPEGVYPLMDAPTPWSDALTGLYLLEVTNTDGVRSTKIRRHTISGTSLKIASATIDGATLTDKVQEI